MPDEPKAAFLFDLDGTLVDSVYQHVLAWHEALDQEGIPLSIWRIHRKVGMSGGLFVNMLLRETGLDIDAARIERLRQRHAEAYKQRSGDVRPLPGARELLHGLREAGIPWAIATSGRMETAHAPLASLGVDFDRDVIVTRDQLKYAKPNCQRRHRDGLRPICVLTPYDGVDPRPFRGDLLAVETDPSRPGFGIVVVRCALRNIGHGPAINVRIAFRLYSLGGYETEACELGPLHAGEVRGSAIEPLRVAVFLRPPLQDQEFAQIPAGSWEIILTYEDVFEQCFYLNASEAPASDESAASLARRRKFHGPVAAVGDFGQGQAACILRRGPARGLRRRGLADRPADMHRNSAANMGFLFKALSSLRMPCIST